LQPFCTDFGEGFNGIRFKTGGNRNFAGKALNFGKLRIGEKTGADRSTDSF
jgi:hypothetical protein